ncbi:MAG: sigma-54-dependent Fis family transcriptional regulator, partial [Nitrospirae bacterium]|nr:sigma-54-dependent Fis family transcriptional regulator [Nitrospirota bacterium]
HWPGNVRQLQSVLERAFLLSEGPLIDEKDLPSEVAAKPDRFDFEIPDEGFSFEVFEREVILKAMRKTDWVIARAAKLLGMSYKTLCYRLEKFQIARPGASPTGDVVSSNEEPR